ncbi:MAG TPA: hypothetical protein PLH23_01840 [Hyphomonadaceae bacterium]|jgi:hypothetical protein|nr:hypothetical protein [Hyphomonadaceae bacterium]HPI46978.1 hypothetical protein [Hyphomonadaceae bacterium]
MNFFEFVLAVIVIGTISSVITGGMRLEREKVKAKRQGYGEEAEQLRGVVGEMHSDIAKLKDRVRVLEKLVTDDDRRLADEIERLRRTETSPRA